MTPDPFFFPVFFFPSPRFVSRAKRLGFTEKQIAQLPNRITQQYERAQIGWSSYGGWADECHLIIGKNRGIMPGWGPKGRMRHELGHVLDDIKTPGLFTRGLDPVEFGWLGYYNAEMVAFGTQLGRLGRLGRPWLAALSASQNRFGYVASVPYVLASVAIAVGTEIVLLELLLE